MVEVVNSGGSSCTSPALWSTPGIPREGRGATVSPTDLVQRRSCRGSSACKSHLIPKIRDPGLAHRPSLTLNAPFTFCSCFAAPEPAAPPKAQPPAIAAPPADKVARDSEMNSMPCKVQVQYCGGTLAVPCPTMPPHYKYHISPASAAGVCRRPLPPLSLCLRATFVADQRF